MFHGSYGRILFFPDFLVIPPLLWRWQSKLLVDGNIANTRHSVLLFFRAPNRKSIFGHFRKSQSWLCFRAAREYEAIC